MVQLSIIIPIYNVEKYINECLKSIYDQKVCDDDFEIIAVNDGTPDKSMMIVEKYALEHDNLRIINKVNEGVASARNVGIAKAIGNYIAFVDADDYIEKDSLENIFKFLYDSTDDLIVLKTKYPDINEETVWNKSIIENKRYTGIEVYGISSKSASWGVLYKRKFINCYILRFPEGIKIAEDTIFIFMCMMYAQTIVFKNVIMYNYLMHEGSASRSYSESYIVSYLLGLNYLCEYDNNHTLTSEQKVILNYIKYRLIVLAINASFRIEYPFKKLYEKIKFYLPIRCVKRMKNKGKIWIWLLNNFYPCLYLKMKIAYHRSLK
jgi:glycosyltransferase, group 2 family protein